LDPRRGNMRYGYYLDMVHFFSFTINASIVTNGVRLALNLRH
jgi:hypothetical protein